MDRRGRRTVHTCQNSAPAGLVLRQLLGRIAFIVEETFAKNEAARGYVRPMASASPCTLRMERRYQAAHLRALPQARNETRALILTRAAGLILEPLDVRPPRCASMLAVISAPTGRRLDRRLPGRVAYRAVPAAPFIIAYRLHMRRQEQAVAQRIRQLPPRTSQSWPLIARQYWSGC